MIRALKSSGTNMALNLPFDRLFRGALETPVKMKLLHVADLKGF